jgi:NADH:ubiquinone reductase (H+-translocating)
VVGGGFGGLQAVKVLRHADVDITLIDRNNYHLFQPLSYQVATGSLAPSEIAAPLRGVFRRDENVRVLLGEVAGFDLQRRKLSVEPIVPGSAGWTISYDSLLVAGGSSYSYFGHEEWRSMALEVKSLDSAIEVRGRILGAFEAAEIESDPNRRASWLTFVVVGAGPTGVEMAGQIAELARATLPAEFRQSDPRAGRVLLIESADRLLTAYPKSLSARAKRSLEKLGVTPLLSHTVIDVRQDCVGVQAEAGATMEIPARTVIWAAGVMASPLARSLGDACGVEIDKAGRLTVEPDLSLPGCPEVLAFGDMVRIRDAKSGEPRTLPGVAPVAMQ